MTDNPINTTWDYTPEKGWEEVGTWMPDGSETDADPEPTGQDQQPETD